MPFKHIRIAKYLKQFETRRTSWEIRTDRDIGADMDHRHITFHSRGGAQPHQGGANPGDEWITAAEFAEKYHVGRSTAYEVFKRLHTIRIGGCVRARRSEIEARLNDDGRI